MVKLRAGVGIKRQKLHKRYSSAYGILQSEVDKIFEPCRAYQLSRILEGKIRSGNGEFVLDGGKTFLEFFDS